mgnify:CR=1 FL=1
MTLDPKLTKMALDVAHGFRRRLPRSILVGDLEQAALIGLLDGLRRSPDGEGPAWEWYLRCRIRGEIIDELRRQDWLGRRRRGRVVPRMLHLEDLTGWEELFPAAGASAEDEAINRLDAAKAWTAPIGVRDTRIMRARFERNARQKDVGADEGVSEARISQRVAVALAGMRCHLTGEDPPLEVPTATVLALWKRQA